VLIDAPCSNLGVIGRRVDVRWRVKPGEISELAQLQGEILNAAAEGVRGGGWLVFSVCTIEPEETTAQRARFLRERPDWSPIALPEFVPADARGEPGELLLLPGTHGTDGAYAFAVRRAGP
jgi:16S rRNA (cytosine967-C5)-methyltransferase